MTDNKNPGDPVEEEGRARVALMREFLAENWRTIVISAATTIVVRLLLGL